MTTVHKKEFILLADDKLDFFFFGTLSMILSTIPMQLFAGGAPSYYPVPSILVQ